MDFKKFRNLILFVGYTDSEKFMNLKKYADLVNVQKIEKAFEY